MGISIEASDCGSCHKAERAQWSTSRHAAAFTNEGFAVSLHSSSPQRWCVDCHGPRPEAREAGIDCAVCHVRQGRVVSSTSPSDAGRAAHPMVRSRALGDSAFCASCHQFPSPALEPTGAIGSKGFFSPHPMQDTYREWAESPAADDGLRCQSCHMGAVGHRFPGAHDQEMVRASVQVSVSRRQGRVQGILKSRGVGHDLPTGDPFRRLELRLCASSSCEVPLLVYTMWRDFAPDGRPGVDHTLPARGQQELDLGVVRGARWWRLDYRFGDRELEALLPPSEVGFVVTEGAIEESVFR